MGPENTLERPQNIWPSVFLLLEVYMSPTTSKCLNKCECKSLKRAVMRCMWFTGLFTVTNHQRHYFLSYSEIIVTMVCKLNCQFME